MEGDGSPAAPNVSVRSEDNMKTKWIISFLVMSVICGLVINTLIVCVVVLLARFIIGFDDRNLIHVVNILSWPLAFFVSYRLWPPKRQTPPPTAGGKE
jgi:hypothetical protein